MQEILKNENTSGVKHFTIKDPATWHHSGGQQIFLEMFLMPQTVRQ